MRSRHLLLATLSVALLPLAAQERTYTNGIGMEFVLIQPGTMQVGVYRPVCPDPNQSSGRAGQTAATGTGAQARPRPQDI